MILRIFFLGSLFCTFSNVAQASLQKYLETYTPKWIQQLAPINSSDAGYQADIEEFEAIFENLKPIPDKTKKHPIFSKMAEFGKKPSITLYGPGVFSTLTFSGNIQSFGPLQLSQVEAHKVSVEGLLNSKQGIFKELHVKGSANLENTKISGMTTISGNLGGKNSSFHNKIIVRGSKIILSGCDIQGDLYIKRLRGQKNPPRVYLLKGSDIQGNVIFSKNASLPCKVFKSSDSKIHGKVENGNVSSFEGATRS
ncbi:MAG: hypothetical protein ACRCYZ_03030 [Alphaproteobacteria bacterium]